LKAPIIIKIIAGQKLINDIIPKPTGLGTLTIPNVSNIIITNNGPVPKTNVNNPVFTNKFNFKNFFIIKSNFSEFRILFKIINLDL